LGWCSTSVVGPDQQRERRPGWHPDAGSSYWLTEMRVSPKGRPPGVACRAGGCPNACPRQAGAPCGLHGVAEPFLDVGELPGKVTHGEFGQNAVEVASPLGEGGNATLPAWSPTTTDPQCVLRIVSVPAA
jgi:hypothetical protein